MLVTEKSRSDAGAALWTGWMVARLAVEREQTLRGPSHYFREFFEPGSAERDAEALADAEFARIARVFGVEVVDLAPNADDA